MIVFTFGCGRPADWLPGRRSSCWLCGVRLVSSYLSRR